MQATALEEKVANISRVCCANNKCNVRVPTRMVLLRAEFLGAMTDKERHRYIYEEMKSMVGPAKAKSSKEISVRPRCGRIVNVRNSYGQQGNFIAFILYMHIYINMLLTTIKVSQHLL